MIFKKAIADEEVRSAIYDDTARHLLLTFASGAKAIFKNVPPKIWRLIPRGSGASRFVRDNVIPKFEGEVVQAVPAQLPPAISPQPFHSIPDYDIEA